jgi:L-fucose isomerase
MAKKLDATRLPNLRRATPKAPVIGVFATSDPRIDSDSRARCQNIVEMAANTISGNVVLPDKTPVPVVYSTVLVDGEAQADIVAQQFRKADVDILVCVPDTWAFPQLTAISLLQQFGRETPFNITCGNSGPRPGVVFAHAANGAIAQYGRMVTLNVGTWPDTGLAPQMTEQTARSLIDWCYAAVTAVALRGRRVVLFGHDSMGMETALAHVIATRQTFGLEITRLDMKLLADMLAKKAYKNKELKDLRGWINRYVGRRLDVPGGVESERFDMSLAMYLIVRDLMADLNAVGGGFMSQLEWGSDPRGVPLPVADVMESFFNSTFDHTGSKAPLPYATEADTQGLLTMLFMTYLSGGNPPLFMDFRKVWEAWEIKELAEKIGVKKLDPSADWYQKGLVDGDNSGSAAFDWATRPGATVKQIMQRVSMPPADPFYFPGGGNSVTFLTPAGIEGIAARVAHSSPSGLFSLIWDEAHTTEVPEELGRAMCDLTTPTWPHTFVVPKYATMTEYKQCPPANHFHMTWNLPVARLQHWMDLTGVLSVTPWAARPRFVEGVDRPQPLIHLINGGEQAYKLHRNTR